MSSYASRKEGQLCPNKNCIQIVHAREKAEDAEAAAALRELEKALTNYQSAEAAAARRSVTCCGPLRSCRHRKRWAAMPQK